MEIGEERIKVLHNWIERLCNPEIDFANSLYADFETTCQSVEEKNFEGGGGNYTELANRKIDASKLFKLSGGNISDSQVKDGQVNIRSDDGYILEGCYKRGVPHGFFRIMNAEGDVDFFGCFVRGMAHGLCWKGLQGGGFLVSPSWEFTSDTTMYLYPDCRTVLFGEFVRGEMVEAKAAQVIGSTGACNYFCGGMKPIISEPSGEVFKFDPSTDQRLSSQPLLQDPYETEFVEVRQSLIPKAGQGLFAKVDIEMGTVFSFYNGLRLQAGEQEHLDEYRIALDENYDLSLPVNMTSLESYSASMGHKVCHSFTPNAEFDTFYHPRFGAVRCLASLKYIEVGDEITVNYRYSLNHAPDWYKVAWAKHQKTVRRLPDWQLAVHLGNFCSSNGNSRLMGRLRSDSSMSQSDSPLSEMSVDSRSGESD